MTHDGFGAAVHRDSGVVRIEVRGELDLATVPELERLLQRLRGEHIDEVLVDLRHVDFLGSTALHLFDRLDADARRDGHHVRFVRPRSDGAWMPFVYVGLAGRLAFVEEQPR